MTGTQVLTAVCGLSEDGLPVFINLTSKGILARPREGGSVLVWGRSWAFVDRCLKASIEGSNERAVLLNLPRKSWAKHDLAGWRYEGRWHPVGAHTSFTLWSRGVQPVDHEVVVARPGTVIPETTVEGHVNVMAGTSQHMSSTEAFEMGPVHFPAEGLVHGERHQVLLDTGASLTAAVNAAWATKMGLPTYKSSRRYHLRYANGSVGWNDDMVTFNLTLGGRKVRV
jgi:hypothetical protein